MIVKLRKGQKYSKILKTIANLNKILLKFKILESSKTILCLKRLSSIPISSLKYFHWLIKIHKFRTKIFRKIEKLKLEKNAKAGVIKLLVTNSSTLESMQKVITKPWRTSLGPWRRKKDEKIKKIQKLEKTAKNFIKY